MLTALSSVCFAVAGLCGMIAVVLETTHRQNARDKTTKARDQARKEELRIERSELIADRDLFSNWNDAWREQYVTDHWHELAGDVAALHAYGDGLQEQIRTGHFHQLALEAGRLLNLSPAEIVQLEDMYRRRAEEPLKQYALIVARKNNAPRPTS